MKYLFLLFAAALVGCTHVPTKTTPEVAERTPSGRLGDGNSPINYFEIKSGYYRYNPSGDTWVRVDSLTVNGSFKGWRRFEFGGYDHDEVATYYTSSGNVTQLTEIATYKGFSVGEKVLTREGNERMITKIFSNGAFLLMFDPEVNELGSFTLQQKTDWKNIVKDDLSPGLKRLNQWNSALQPEAYNPFFRTRPVIFISKNGDSLAYRYTGEGTIELRSCGGHKNVHWDECSGAVNALNANQLRRILYDAKHAGDYLFTRDWDKEELMAEIEALLYEKLEPIAQGG